VSKWQRHCSGRSISTRRRLRHHRRDERFIRTFPGGKLLVAVMEPLVPPRCSALANMSLGFCLVLDAR